MNDELEEKLASVRPGQDSRRASRDGGRSPHWNSHGSGFSAAGVACCTAAPHDAKQRCSREPHLRCHQGSAGVRMGAALALTQTLPPSICLLQLTWFMLVLSCV